MITKITTHIADAKNRLLMQYRDSPNLGTLIDSVYGQAIQDIEDVIAAMYSRLDIDGSDGAQLDGIGRIVGLARSGWSDALYRLLLKAKCGQLVSRGSIENIISVWKIVAQANRVQVVEVYPGQVDLYSDSPIAGDLTQFVYDLMQKVTSGGVEVNFLAIVFSLTNAFGFDPDDANVNGFGDLTDPPAGGELAYIQLT